jgi:hypothetical protein
MTLYSFMRLTALSAGLGLPSYVINNFVVVLLLASFNVPGVTNISAVWIGDVVGVVSAVSLQYFVWSKSDRVRRWLGFKGPKACPKCGALLS